MEKTRVLSAATVALLACLLLTTCRKFDWKGPIVNCKILETSDRIVSYNSWGDPTSVKFKVDPDATGNPTSYFVYDAQRRLIAYGGGNDHRLTYNSKGQAIIDTMIMNYAGQDDRFAQRLYYDIYGRIIKVVEKQYHTGFPDPDFPPVFEEHTTLYQYDSRGNLIQPGVSYDNKVCLYRTSPVWMLVHRNYSLNNPVGASGYNAQGLPRYFPATFLERENASDIRYSCDGQTGK